MVHPVLLVEVLVDVPLGMSTILLMQVMMTIPTLLVLRTGKVHVYNSPVDPYQRQAIPYSQSRCSIFYGTCSQVYCCKVVSYRKYGILIHGFIIYNNLMIDSNPQISVFTNKGEWTDKRPIHCSCNI